MNPTASTARRAFHSGRTGDAGGPRLEPVIGVVDRHAIAELPVTRLQIAADRGTERNPGATRFSPHPTARATRLLVSRGSRARHALQNARPASSLPHLTPISREAEGGFVRSGRASFLTSPRPAGTGWRDDPSSPPGRRKRPASSASSHVANPFGPSRSRGAGRRGRCGGRGRATPGGLTDGARGDHRAVDKSPQTGIELSIEEAEEEARGGPDYPPESTYFTELISSPGLTVSYFEDDDANIVLLFVRLRSLLFELCPDHPVALCATCRRTYTPEQLGTEIGDGCYLCRQCGADLRESVIAHARMCANLILQKPLARMVPVNRSTVPPAVSERFAARRRARLGVDVHAAAG